MHGFKLPYDQICKISIVKRSETPYVGNSSFLRLPPKMAAHQNFAIQSQKSTFIYHNFLSQGFFLTRAGLSALLNDCKSVIFWSPSENKLPPQAQRVQQTKVYFQQNFIFVTKLVTKHETVNSFLTWQLQLQWEFSSILDYSIVCLFVLSFNSRRNSTE